MKMLIFDRLASKTLISVAAALLLFAPSGRTQTIYVSSASSTIDKVSPTGVVTLFATLPALSSPFSLAFDASGYLYSANQNNHNISKISPDGSTVTNFATLSGVQRPYSLAFDTSGNLYTADENGNQVSKINSLGVVIPFAVLPTNADTTALTFDSSGNLYALDFNAGNGSTIFKVTAGGSSSLFAVLPALSQSYGLAFKSGILYASIQNTNQIMQIDSVGGVTAFATLPTGSSPYGLAFDPSGNLYAADLNSGQISKITPDGLTVTSYASGITQAKGLAILVVPEPSSWAALLGGPGLLCGAQRWRGSRRRGGVAVA